MTEVIRNRLTYRLILIFYLFMVVQIDAVAQSESQLTKSSKAFFLKQDYNKALDGYRQLLSNDLSNIDYNYRYAVCLFYTKSPKSSETYFNYLMEQSDCPIEVFYFKGKLHHINYQFDDAIALYSKYLSLKTKKSNDFSCAEEIKQQSTGTLPDLLSIADSLHNTAAVEAMQTNSRLLLEDLLSHGMFNARRALLSSNPLFSSTFFYGTRSYSF